MSDQSSGPVSVSLKVDAPADRLFALLACPANHPRIDGSGMVRGGEDAVVTGVGDVFTMAMHNDEMGDYEMSNHVVGYEANRLIAWEPVLNAASRPEDQDMIGVEGHVRWTYELEPLDGGSTLVTETYDCTNSPDWLRRAVKNGERWRDSMTASLENLTELAHG